MPSSQHTAPLRLAISSTAQAMRYLQDRAGLSTAHPDARFQSGCHSGLGLPCGSSLALPRPIGPGLTLLGTQPCVVPDSPALLPPASRRRLGGWPGPTLSAPQPNTPSLHMPEKAMPLTWTQPSLTLTSAKSLPPGSLPRPPLLGALGSQPPAISQFSPDESCTSGPFLSCQRGHGAQHPSPSPATGRLGHRCGQTDLGFTLCLPWTRHGLSGHRFLSSATGPCPSLHRHCPISHFLSQHPQSSKSSPGPRAPGPPRLALLCQTHSSARNSFLLVPGQHRDTGRAPDHLPEPQNCPTSLPRPAHAQTNPLHSGPLS